MIMLRRPPRAVFWRDTDRGEYIVRKNTPDGRVCREVDLDQEIEFEGACKCSHATLFTLTRENFEHIPIERPASAASFDDFILRVLADRVDFANHAITALST
jgi:hypothetical protein